ncbi:MAG TPA: hypothetical protein VGV15_05465, partial [Terriglobales bacterium]|nr:hypothetical protein [Terriglobales bacterium]
TEGKWLNISGNLPSVVVSDLVYHHKDRTLNAATYGRGVWHMRPGNLVPPAAVAGPAPEQVAMAAGLRVDPRVAAPVPLTPPDDMVVDATSRQILVTLPPIPGALGYQLEFVAAAELFRFGLSSTTPEIQLPAMGSGKWRVWAVLPDGLRSAASEWRSITDR